MKLFRIFIIIPMLIVGGLSYLFISANSIDTHFVLQAPHGSVKIDRDKYGIPHIYASQSDLDAFYALGYVHAQDRLWQMEFQRRVVTGTLSEIFGRKTLKQDEYLRTWGFYHAAEQAWNALDPHTKQIIHAYTEGVNRYLLTGKKPIQFYLLGIHSKPWTDIDSIAWQKMMAWNLDSTWQVKIKNYLIAKQFGNDKLSTFLPAYPLQAPTVLSNLDLQQTNIIHNNDTHTQTNKTQFTHQLALNDTVKKELGFEDSPGKGSNSWVISGKLTQTGKPILTNDPHLALAAPSLWYQAELKGPSLHVIGATIPGLPLVVIGHNDHIAWGITSSYVDEQDLYIESQNTSITTRKEIIAIKGEKPEVFIVRTSNHGPIISDVTQAKHINDNVALKWNALQPGDTTVKSFVALDYAQNWNQFVSALHDFVTPAQNFLYADTSGNIGYYLAGKIPIRNGWTGALPIEPKQISEWKEYIPFEQLPHVLNPPEGYIASANNQITTDAYPYALTFRWSVPPFRINRIDEMIQQNIPLNMQKSITMQADTKSNLWLALKDSLLKTKPLNAESKIGLTYLAHWNGNMDTSSIAASLFSYWYQELIHSSFHIDDAAITADPMFIVNELQSNQCYLDNTKNSCNKLLSISLKNAMDNLIKNQGKDQRQWRWGNVHHVSFEELAIGKSKLLGWLWNRHAPASGGDYTVNVGTYDSNTMNQTNGASYRQIIDLADLNNSMYVIPLGENDNPFNFSFNNQLTLWLHNQYVPMK